MSRIGKVPIEIPTNVQVNITGQNINVKGEKGELRLDVHPKIALKQEGNQLFLLKKNQDKLARSLHGLNQRLISNMIQGVSQGFEKKLEIIGVGYRGQISGEKLVLFVGYSHPVEIAAGPGISFKLEKNIITVSGLDKQLVGQVAANIRAVRKPEAYKGKGIRYLGEQIKIKPGKIAKTATT